MFLAPLASRLEAQELPIDKLAAGQVGVLAHPGEIEFEIRDGKVILETKGDL